MERPTPTDVEHEVTDVDMIVSKADAEGNITYTNPIFMKVSGYSQGDLLDQPHAILRHPDMPKAIFKYLWENIKAGKDVYAFVKNLCKDGGYYLVLAQVRMAKNPDGSFRNYVSTRRRMTQKAREVILPLYAKLLEIEKSEGVEASEKALMDFLAENGQSADTFNDFMQSLNK
ncbi:PAS domain-containing protein [Sulfurimonas sp. HSL-3221]|uniref:PAS domain-containing protein n=1 Tax=Sulfurimonadaceae TaxID=2771471 RepID=UPI001E5D2B65|nr:PAS domain-containing protein [Sulfurimonas sp. HSL-3221]UFS61745.1 PAS domain-containing protein [Sulfurimonas sp. HSL-3221]